LANDFVFQDAIIKTGSLRQNPAELSSVTTFPALPLSPKSKSAAKKIFLKLNLKGEADRSETAIKPIKKNNLTPFFRSKNTSLLLFAN